MEATYNARYYFDLRKERKSAKNGESAYTPAVALIAALGAALDWIAAQAATAAAVTRFAPRDPTKAIPRTNRTGSNVIMRNLLQGRRF